MRKRALILLSLLCLAWLPTAQARSVPDAVLTLDAPAGTTLPRRFRTAATPFIGAGVPLPSRRGLDNLRISGSSQFAPGGLDAVLAGLPGRVTLVDLRRESHGFYDDAAISWFAPDNQGNPGLDAREVAAVEDGLLAGLDGRADVTVARIIKEASPGGADRRDMVRLGPGAAHSEADEAALRGVGSFRVAVSDHHRPDDAAVDRFILFYRDLAPDVWLHFHCRGGAGRTTTFMLMTDMLRNAREVSFEDLLVRQWLLGGIDLRAISGGDERADAARERLDFLRRFYDYAKANPGGRPLTWSRWLAESGAP